MYDIKIKLKDFDRPCLFILYYETADGNDDYHFVAHNHAELKEKIIYALEVKIPGDACNFWLYKSVLFDVEEVGKKIRDVDIVT